MAAIKTNTAFGKAKVIKHNDSVANVTKSEDASDVSTTASAKLTEQGINSQQTSITSKQVNVGSSSANQDAIVSKPETGAESEVSIPAVKMSATKKSVTKPNSKVVTAKRTNKVGKAKVLRTAKSSSKATKPVRAPVKVSKKTTTSKSKKNEPLFTKSNTVMENKTSVPVLKDAMTTKSEIQPSINIVAKSTSKSADVQDPNIEFGFTSLMEIFNMQNFEIPNAIREVAEQSIEQAQATYDKVKSATEEATSALEDAIKLSRKHSDKINEKVLDATKANTSAAFDFFKDVIAVNSMSEVFELQSGFAQEQLSVVSKQGEEIQELTVKFVTEFTSPVKEVFSKTFGAHLK